jgi:uncharacterized membrane protein
MAEITSSDIRAQRGISSQTAAPQIAQIDLRDIRAVLALAAADLGRAPVYGLAIGAFYAVGGIVLYLLATRTGLFFLTYPLAAGFALLGPFCAVVLYEISRRLESSLPLSPGALVSVVVGPGGRSLGWMPMLNLFVFFIWVDVAAALYLGFFGLRRPDLGGFVVEVFTTWHGLSFLVLGNLVGAVFAIGVFTSTVVAYPLLLDRDSDFVTAIITSWRAVRANPVPMLGYGLIVAVSLFVAMLPALLGLIVVLPLLGHSTWHLYRRVVRWPDGGTG